MALVTPTGSDCSLLSAVLRSLRVEFWRLLPCHTIFKVVTILDVTVDIFLESYHFFSWQYTLFLSLNVISLPPGSGMFPSTLLPNGYAGNQWKNRIASQLFVFFFPPPV